MERIELVISTRVLKGLQPQSVAQSFWNINSLNRVQTRERNSLHERSLNNFTFSLMRELMTRESLINYSPLSSHLIEKQLFEL